MPLPEMSTAATSEAQTTAPDVTPSPGSTDELASGLAHHVVRSGGLTIDVTYSVATPTRWASDGGTPVQVEVAVRDRVRKIYLTRTTMRFVVNDGTSNLPGPDPLVDTTNLTPGYLVTPPYSYVQSFSVPPVDRTAQVLTMNVKLELVSLVDKKAKDYSKQTVTDVLTTVVAV
ncbi:hypothetical protein [Microlunatus antarcticus]|uniref:Uncharacterized protein n=1 Tax=Microlunatus antarcticus TaxID=53388 RepID=A0A7W5JU57_9ACTN|nr:hypothetical protein [Microlunatus antarcticus]MBB3326111.1 hypothetical protein [Microlunatus antarcticus]